MKTDVVEEKTSVGKNEGRKAKSEYMEYYPCYIQMT